MPKSRRPYPLEYRQRIIELVRAGRSPESLAQEFEPTAPAFGIGSAKPTATTGAAATG
jgi:transposase-like protein